MDYSPGARGWPVATLGTGLLSYSLCLLPYPHCPEVESRHRREQAAGSALPGGQWELHTPPPGPSSGRTLGAASAELDEAQRALEFKNQGQW